MISTSQELASQAARLPPNERLKLVETILATLDQPDPVIGAAWEAEAEDRLMAYQQGTITAVDESDVFGNLDHP